MKIKTILLTVILTAFSVSAWSQIQLSKEAIDYIDNFNTFRMETTVLHNDKKAAAVKVDAYKSKHPYSSLSEQEQLIIESLILMEDYNYTWEDKSNDSRLQKLLLAQIDKNEKYITAHPDAVSGWLYLITADCFSCYMSYNPVSGALKYGTKLKKYYENCVTLDPGNSTNYTHLAQWFYWAPGINGGSMKKALANGQTGVTNARTNAEKFYAELLYSQLLYENKDKTGAASHLAKAKSYCPKSMYIKQLEDLNVKGYSLFTYNKNKAEDENRVKQ